MTPLPTPPDPVQTPQPAQAVSPTGQALVSAKLAPFFASAAAVCAVVAGAAKIPGLHLPDEVFAYATLLTLIFTTLLGTTPGLRKVVPMLLLVLSVGLGAPSCATTAAGVVNVSVTSTKALGQLFLTTATAIDAAYDAKLISEPQYAPWRDFSLRFQAAFAIADKTLEAAAETNDVSVQGVIRAELDRLERELSTFQALAATVTKKPGGGS